MAPKTFSPEYSSYIRSAPWYRRRKSAFSLFMGRDALIPLLKAHEADHITYRNLKHEAPIRDILPLHRNTHSFITKLRAFLKGRSRRVTPGQKALAWVMRLWALLMLPIIWIIWGRMWALVAGVAIALILV